MTKVIRAVFISDLRCSSASGRQRLWGMQQCGVEVTVVNKQNYASPWERWGGRLAKVLKQPRFMGNGKRLGRDLLKICSEVQPDLVWFEWPREINVRILGELKKLACHPLLVSFQDDNPWGDRYGDRWMWKDYFKVVPEFALHVVKRSSDLKHLTALGARRCLVWEHGVYHPLFNTTDVPRLRRYPVCFIGTCMDDRDRLVGHLLEQGIPLQVFGSHWEHRSDLPRRFPGHFHAAVVGKEYAEVLKQSQICLGLVSKSNHDEWTMRSWEVPACGSLLVAERTPTHEEWFDDGEDAALFATAEECVSLLRDLLENPTRMRRMAEAGQEKVLRSGQGLDEKMSKLLKELEL